MLTPLELAVIELTNARQTVRDAKVARRNARLEHGECDSTGEYAPCYERSELARADWCPACSATQPPHEALHKASRRARSAMLRVLGFGRRLQLVAKAPNGDRFTLPLFEDPPSEQRHEGAAHS